MLFHSAFNSLPFYVYTLFFFFFQTFLPRFKWMTMEEEEVVEGVISSEHYSSGSCQSGWTAYLDHQSWPCHHSLLLCDKNSVSSSSSSSSFSSFRSHVHPQQEEDISMVSDASSRPPQLHRAIHRHDDDDDGRKRRAAEADRQQGCSSSLLEDTASSHLKRKKMRHLESFPAMKPTSRPVVGAKEGGEEEELRRKIR